MIKSFFFFFGSGAWCGLQFPFRSVRNWCNASLPPWPPVVVTRGLSAFPASKTRSALPSRPDPPSNSRVLSSILGKADLHFLSCLPILDQASLSVASASVSVMSPLPPSPMSFTSTFRPEEWTFLASAICRITPSSSGYTSTIS